MSKENQKKILLAVLLLVFVGVLFNQFVRSDESSPNLVADRAMMPTRAKNGNGVAHRPLPRQERKSATAEPEQGYRPLPLQALRTKLNVGKDAERNVFVYYVPPPPPPPVEPPKPPPPIAIHSVNPSAVFAKTKDFTLQVFGMDFPEDVQIFVNGRALKTTRAGRSELTATVEKQLIAVPGQLRVEVKNSTGALYSNPLNVAINEAPAPPYTYIGRIDNLVYLQKGQDAPLVARLGQTVENRWRVAGITGPNVVLEDVALGIPYTIAMEEYTSSVAGVQPMGDFSPQNQRFVNQRRIQKVNPQGVAQPQPEPNPSDEEEP